MEGRASLFRATAAAAQRASLAGASPLFTVETVSPRRFFGGFGRGAGESEELSANSRAALWRAGVSPATCFIRSESKDADKMSAHRGRQRRLRRPSFSRLTMTKTDQFVA